MRLQKTIRINGRKYTGRQLRDLAIAQGIPTIAAKQTVDAVSQMYNTTPDVPYEMYVRIGDKVIALRFRRIQDDIFHPVCDPRKADYIDVFLDGYFMYSPKRLAIT